MPADGPEEEQAPGDVAGFGRAVAIDEPRQRGAIALEILTHAIQPFDLRRSDQAVRRQGGFGHAIARQPLQGVVAFTRGGELERRVRPHGFEHLVQRASRDCALGSQQQALIDQGSCRAERFVAPRRGTVVPRNDGCGCFDRKPARQHAETAEYALLVRAKQLITPGDRRIHRLLALGEIARPDGREQDVMLESAQ